MSATTDASSSRALVIWQPPRTILSRLKQIPPLVLVTAAALGTYVALPLIASHLKPPVEVADVSARPAPAPRPVERVATPAVATPTPNSAAKAQVVLETPSPVATTAAVVSGVAPVATRKPVELLPTLPLVDTPPPAAVVAPPAEHVEHVVPSIRPTADSPPVVIDPPKKAVAKLAVTPAPAAPRPTIVAAREMEPARRIEPHPARSFALPPHSFEPRSMMHADGLPMRGFGGVLNHLVAGFGGGFGHGIFGHGFFRH